MIDFQSTQMDAHSHFFLFILAHLLAHPPSAFSVVFTWALPVRHAHHYIPCHLRCMMQRLYWSRATAQRAEMCSLQSNTYIHLSLEYRIDSTALCLSESTFFLIMYPSYFSSNAREIECKWGIRWAVFMYHLKKNKFNHILIVLKYTFLK